MKKYDRITPDGTGDSVFVECDANYQVVETLRRLFKSYGYGEIRTPTIEFFDAFSHGIGKISQDTLYTLTDNNGRLLSLRPDSTKPVARLFASRLYKKQSPLRIYYNQHVFRRSIKFCKKSDEYLQTGVELIDSASIKADVEVITLAVKSMKALFGDDFYIEIGHMGLLRPLLNAIEDEDIRREVRSAIALKNYPEIDRLSGIIGNAGNVLREIPRLFGAPSVLDYAGFIFKSDTTRAVLSDLKSLCNVAATASSKDNVLADLAVLNEYEYYTGAVFRGYIKGQGVAILSGGRYDTLYSDYNLNVPAVGFAINTDLASRIILEKTSAETPQENIAVLFSKFDDANLEQQLKVYAKKGYKTLTALFDLQTDARNYAIAVGAKMFVVLNDGVVYEENIGPQPNDPKR
ncbi:MAG: ATP phosphoribosyltransferase regulatory subunit [Christensenellaceae bacterium]|jgi:ATP phosphoribosyltransferase regulatory subunit|nr:ATP phosphoribosyltransferase regulatory subunit [Christensenellaceae bacterium]